MGSVAGLTVMVTWVVLVLYGFRWVYDSFYREGGRPAPGVSMNTFPTYDEFLHIAMSQTLLPEGQLYKTEHDWLLMLGPIQDAKGRFVVYNRVLENLRLQYGMGARIFWFLKPIAVSRRERAAYDGYGSHSSDPVLHMPFPGPYYRATRGRRTLARVHNVRISAKVKEDKEQAIAAGTLLFYRAHTASQGGTTGILVMT